MPDLVQDIALLLTYTIQDFPDVEPLESHFPEVKKDGLIIKNTMYKSPVLRKMHLELAEIDGMKILHSVLFPDPHYKLPIFGCDIVATEKAVTAAIVDVSPVYGVDDKFYKEIGDISKNFNFKGRRPLPLWGDDIFSPFCKFTRLNEDIDMANFYCLVLNYLCVFRDAALSAKRDSFWVDNMKRLDDQVWYCESQKKNDKTRGILEKWFDKDWTDTYMNEVLFDAPCLK